MSKGKPVLWAELSWPEMEKVLASTDTVLLPVGSTEQHGRHLPLGVDIFIPVDIARRVSAETGVPVLPSVNFVPCAWHECFPGAISITPRVLISQLVDIARSLQNYGVRNIILVNGHTGGCDSTLVAAADEVLQETACRFYIASVVDVAADEVLSICSSPVLGHADEVETAKMMAIRPDLVHIEGVKANDREPKSGYLSVNYRRKSRIFFRTSKEDWKALAPEGYIGDPSAATPEKGEAMLSRIASEISGFIKDLENGHVI